MIGLTERVRKKERVGKGAVYMTEPQSRPHLRVGKWTQKSRGRKIVGLWSENMTSMLMVSLLHIFHAL